VPAPKAPEGQQLTMKKHIAKVAAVCFFHIRRLRQIRRHVGKDVTIRLVLALITLRLDYCNSVFAGLLQSTLEPLQRVQNTAARLVFDLRHRDHVLPYLMQLHWLPVRSRVQFKLCTLMHAIHNQRSPSYLSDTLQTVATATTRCGLRSSATVYGRFAPLTFRPFTGRFAPWTFCHLDVSPPTVVVSPPSVTVLVCPHL